MSTRSKIALIAAVILVVGLVPVRQTVAPEWTVTTLDAARRPLTGVTVREVWQQYSLENSSHEEDRLTDNNGKVRVSSPHVVHEHRRTIPWLCASDQQRGSPR